MRLIEPKSQAQLHERIAYLRTLEPNWDSYGSLTIEPDVAAIMGQIVDALVEAGHDDLVSMAEIFPVANGGMQIEFDGVTADVELEVEPDLRFGFLVCPAGRPHSEWQEFELPARTPIEDVIQVIREAEPNVEQEVAA